MRGTRNRVSIPGFVACCLLAATPAAAQPSAPLGVPPPGKAATEHVPMLREVGVDQRLDNPLPLDTAFTDETGRQVRLRQYFGQRPVILLFAYYECPMLCTMVLTGVSGSLEALPFDAGKDFEVVVVSIDPGETPALARDRKADFVRRYGRAGAGAGLHFLTGRQESIGALADAAGFRYAYDAAIDQYAHPAVVTVATADGRVSRYLFGIDFPPRDLRLALVEAGAGRIGTAIDQALLFCYHYDPTTGRYGLAIMNVVRVAGLLTVAVLAGSIAVSLRRERRRRHNAVAETATGIR
jgi:protein SCO1/2